MTIFKITCGLKSLCTQVLIKVEVYKYLLFKDVSIYFFLLRLYSLVASLQLDYLSTYESKVIKHYIDGS